MNSKIILTLALVSSSCNHYMEEQTFNALNAARPQIIEGCKDHEGVQYVIISGLPTEFAFECKAYGWKGYIRIPDAYPTQK